VQVFARLSSRREFGGADEFARARKGRDSPLEFRSGEISSPSARSAPTEDGLETSLARVFLCRWRANDKRDKKIRRVYREEYSSNKMISFPAAQLPLSIEHARNANVSELRQPDRPSG